MWQSIPKNLKVLKPRINKSGQLVYGVSPKDAGKSFEDLLKISVKYQDYRNFLTEHCLRFETFLGKPVVECFNALTHTANYPGVLKDSPLVLAFDFGGTNPAYGIGQAPGGRLLIHKSVKPQRQSGFEIDIDSICKRLLAEFKDKDSPFYNSGKWDFIVIGDHAGTYENNQGVPGKAAEIVEKHFGTNMISYHMTSDVYRQSLALVTDVFSKAGLITVNPNCQMSLDTFKGGWHYPEHVDKQSKPKPEVDGVYIHIGDLWRYAIWHFFRYEEPLEHEISQLEKPGSEFLELEKGLRKGFHFGR